MQEKKEIRIIVTGGGTAGHVTPILSIAEEIILRQPKAIIRFVGYKSDARAKVLVGQCEAIDKSYSITTGKLRRFYGRGVAWYLRHPSIIFNNFIDIFKVLVGTMQSVLLLIKWRPAVVFVKGGFVGLPVGLASIFLRIKIVTHDSDAVPGLTNRLLSKFASVSAVALPTKYYQSYYKLSKTIQTGVPISKKFFKKELVKELKVANNISFNSQVLCIIGGSLGAVRINNTVASILPSLLKSRPELKIFWASGDIQYKELKMVIDNLGYADQIVLKPYFEKLDEIFRMSDLVVSRAGATTIAELSALKKACIFIPNPVLTGGHQTKNANILEQNKAAVIVSEKELEQDSNFLTKTIINLLENPKKQQILAENLAQFSDEQATTKLAKVILEVT